MYFVFQNYSTGPPTKPGLASMPTGAPQVNSYHSPGSFSPAVNGGPPPPTSSPDQTLLQPGQPQRGPLPPTQYMNGSMGPPPGPGRGPVGGPSQPMPPQPGNILPAHAHMPSSYGMPPQPGGMPPSVGGMPPPGVAPPQHGGSSFQPLIQPGPPMGKPYLPSSVSEYLKREFHVLCYVHLTTWMMMMTGAVVSGVNRLQAGQLRTFCFIPGRERNFSVYRLSRQALG